MVLTNIRIWRDFIFSRESDVADKRAGTESINPKLKRKKLLEDLRLRLNPRMPTSRKLTFQIIQNKNRKNWKIFLIELFQQKRKCFLNQKIQEFQLY